MDKGMRQDIHAMAVDCDTWTLDHALEHGTKEEILIIFQREINPRCIGEDGNSALLAILKNYKLMEDDVVEFLTYFLIRGVDPNLKNARGQTALHLAIDRRMVNAVNLLIKYTADVYTVDNYGNSTAKSKETNIHCDFTIILNAIREKREMCIVRSLINVYLKKCSNKNLLTALFVELIGTCQSWKKSENDYFLATLHDLIAQGASVEDELSRKKLVFIAIEAKNLHLLIFLKQNIGFNFSLKNGRNLLHYLADHIDYKDSNIDFVRNFSDFLIHNVCDVNAKDECKRTALHVAVAFENELMIQILTELGADINCVDEYLRTPLHGALRTNVSIQLIELLLTKGSDVNAKDKEGKMPLHFAVQKNELSVVQLLLDFGAFANCRDANQKTPLHCVVMKDVSDEIVELLLVNGAEANATDSWGESLLDIAIFHNKLPIAQKLVDYGASVNCKNRYQQTPLHRALINPRYLEIMEFLAANKADFNARDSAGNSPLDLTISYKNWSLAEYLIAHGADVSDTDENQRTSLHRAVIQDKVIKRIRSGMSVDIFHHQALMIIEFLVSNGANLDTKDSNGETPLHLAVSHNHLVFVQSLIEQGASINCKNNNQQTPLHLAVEMDEKMEIIEFLLENGAEVNAKDAEGNRPLHQIFKRQKLEDECLRVLEMLLENGAYVNARNNEEKSALFLALTFNDMCRIEELMNYGANLNCSEMRELVREFSWKLNQDFSDHLVKLKAARLPLEQECSRYFYDNQFQLQKYYNQCLKEIEKLKNTTVGDGRSLFDFLHMSPRIRGLYINCEEVLQLIESLNLKQQFPIYSTLILGSYHDAVMKKPLLEPAQEALHELIPAILPDVVDYIFGHLNEEDLINIIKANALVDGAEN